MRLVKNVFSAITNYLKKTDLFLWFFSIVCVSYGVTVLYAAELSFSLGGLRVHVFAAVIGFVGMFILTKIDFMRLCEYWYIHTIFAYGLVIALFFIGTGVSGSDNTNWIIVPIGSGISLQPTEFLKLSFILTYAAHIGKVGDNINKPLQLFLLILHAAVPVIIIHQLGDDGTAIIFILIAVAMLIISGLKWYYILLGAGLAVVGFALAWQFDIIGVYQKNRFLIIYGGLIDEAISYQQDLSLVSMGSGGMFGGGLFGVEHMFVPVLRNDFVFSFIGQCLGLIGTGAVVVLLAAILIRILVIAGRSVFKEGRAICGGAFGLLAAQAIINIGMCIKIIPVIGITLPFFSQGGSSILATLLLMGLVISVYTHNEQTIYKFRRK